MAINIPSINLPFTDSRGRINPIWHEFLRSFVSATVAGTVSGNVTTTSVTAGAGLTGGGAGAVTLNVGQGQGIAVNANDVGVDISNQTAITSELNDEILISDISDNNTIRKTTLRDVVRLSSPGGSDGQVQYNSNGGFGGDSAFTTDGAGNVTIGNLNFNGNTIISSNTNGDINVTPNGTGAVVFNKVIHNSAGSNTTRGILFSGNSLRLLGTTSTSYIEMNGTPGWNIQADSSKVLTVSSTGMTLNGLNFSMLSNAILRWTVSGITASTTQTQGQGLLTGDINEISTCANANDTVTLPAALAGRFCTVINNGANTLKIYPSSGGDLGAGVNISTTLAAGAAALFLAYTSLKWRQMI